MNLSVYMKYKTFSRIEYTNFHLHFNVHLQALDRLEPLEALELLDPQVSLVTLELLGPRDLLGQDSPEHQEPQVPLDLLELPEPPEHLVTLETMVAPAQLGSPVTLVTPDHKDSLDQLDHRAQLVRIQILN